MRKAPVLAVLVTLLSPAAQARQAVKGLSEADAAVRSRALDGVSYALRLSVDASSPEFAGAETIGVLVKAVTGPLTLDFAGGTLESLSVDGKAVDPRYNGLFATLPPLALGPHRLDVRWRHAYSATGEGLYRFKDPEDGRVYVYSDFEPYNANKLFPSFDQPDLKARFTLEAEAPSSWTVVSTTRETKIEDAPGDRKLWTFPETAPLSTYVFSLHAGEYEHWKSTAGAIPLRLFARASLAKYVDPEEWFETTREGLAFYGDYFGVPYPFGKYDQLIVPDYNAGAMENVGAITFSERYVRRGARTRAEREDLAETILHEMAHMWFGDYVTTAWWDGLWLNESFAEYMASLSASKATEYKEAWRSFFIDDKTWAYREDQQPTTHPIEANVPDTEVAFSNFDGITYGKGASALKQLAHLLGEDAFRDGVRLYLSQRAFGSARESDFFSALEQTGNAKLGPWAKDWLETTGVDSVSADWSCADGRLRSLSLAQAGKPLRLHKTQVALYDAALAPQAAADVLYQDPRTPVPTLAEKPCPALVFPNAGDYDYVKPVLDERSLAAATRSLEEAKEPLLRAMLWHALWDMVRDARWPVTRYERLVLAKIGAEPDFKTAKMVLKTVYDGFASVLVYDPHPQTAAFERLFWDKLSAAPSGGDEQKLWLDAYLATALTPQAQQRLRDLLDGRGPAGLALDQDRRWDALTRLSALGAPDAPALIDAEAKKDASDKGVKGALAARAAWPDPAKKRARFAELADPASKESLGDQRAAMAAQLPREQLPLRGRLAPAYFAALPKLAKSKDEEFLGAFASNLAPRQCTRASVAAFDAFLAKHGSLPPPIVKNVRIARAEDARCVAARAVLKR